MSTMEELLNATEPVSRMIPVYLQEGDEIVEKGQFDIGLCGGYFTLTWNIQNKGDFNDYEMEELPLPHAGWPWSPMYGKAEYYAHSSSGNFQIHPLIKNWKDFSVALDYVVIKPLSMEPRDPIALQLLENGQVKEDLILCRSIVDDSYALFNSLYFYYCASIEVEPKDPNKRPVVPWDTVRCLYFDGNGVQIYPPYEEEDIGDGDDVEDSGEDAEDSGEDEEDSGEDGDGVVLCASGKDEDMEFGVSEEDEEGFGEDAEDSGEDEEDSGENEDGVVLCASGKDEEDMEFGVSGDSAGSTEDKEENDLDSSEVDNSEDDDEFNLVQRVFRIENILVVPGGYEEDQELDSEEEGMENDESEAEEEENDLVASDVDESEDDAVFDLVQRMFRKEKMVIVAGGYEEDQDLDFEGAEGVENDLSEVEEEINEEDQENILSAAGDEENKNSVASGETDMDKDESEEDEENKEDEVAPIDFFRRLVRIEVRENY